MCLPRISDIVIARTFPVTGDVPIGQFDLIHPLSALPRKEFWNNQTHWPTVISVDWLSIVCVSQDHIIILQRLQRNIGCPAVIVGSYEGKFCRREHVGLSQQMANRNASPQITESRPCGDAMKVGKDLNPRQLPKLFQRKLQRLRDESTDFQRPLCNAL